MGIGKRIREARTDKGLSQEQLGKMIGVTGSAITNYEKEISHPKESVMYALIDALEVDANYLFQDCVHTIKKSPSEGEEMLLRLYRKLNDEGQEKLLDYADDLVQSEKYIKTDAGKLVSEA